MCTSACVCVCMLVLVCAQVRLGTYVLLRVRVYVLVCAVYTWTLPKHSVGMRVRNNQRIDLIDAMLTNAIFENTRIYNKTPLNRGTAAIQWRHVLIMPSRNVLPALGKHVSRFHGE